MPSFGTVFRWLNERPEFKSKYRFAIEVKAAGYIDETVEIADEAAHEPTVASVAAARLRIDTRFKAGGKLDPTAWSDRVKLDATVDVGAKLAAGVRALSDEELAAIIAMAEKMLQPPIDVTPPAGASSSDEAGASPETASGAPDDDPGAPLDGEVLPPQR